MEIETPHQHHPAHTGHGFLDVALGLAAFAVSVVSLWLGIHSAHTMEKLVAANSYPNIDANTSNVDKADPTGRPLIHYEIESSGIGPARVGWVVLAFKGKPVHDVAELLAACCSGLAGDTSILSSGNIGGDLLPVGKSMRLLTWYQPKAPNPKWDALFKEMTKVDISACYCSVFDECFVRRPNQSRPESVAACTMPPVPFHANKALQP